MNEILIGKIASAVQLQGALSGERQMSGAFHLYELPQYQYEGTYEFTPSSQTQYAPTAYMTCLGDIKINPIPSEYIIPSGTKYITSNGTEDVTEYADVDVNVQPALESITKSYTPTESSQTETVTAGVGYDGIEEVDITVNPIPSQYIVPSGTLSITENGTEDVTSYADVDVDVQPSLETVTRAYTPSNSSQSDTITAGVGYDGIEEVDITVNPIPSQYIIPTGTKNITSNGTEDVTSYASVSVSVLPTVQGKSVTTSSSGTIEVTPDVGYDALSKVTITTPSVSWGTPTNTITKEGGQYKYSRAYPNFSDGYLDEADGVYFDLDLETKSVTPTESSQTVTPTDNYSYLDSVTVNAIPSNYVGTGVARCDEDDVSFNINGLVGVTNGYYPSNTVKQIPSASIYGGYDAVVTPSITVDASGEVTATVVDTQSFAFCYGSGWVNTSANTSIRVQGENTYQLTVGDNLEYGITDGTLPLVGVAKAGYAEI